MPILRQAIDVLALRGTCGFVGGAPENSELTFVTSHVMNGGRTIRGIILGDTNPEEFLPKLIELHAFGRFPLEKLVTFYPFKDVNRAIGELAEWQMHQTHSSILKSIILRVRILPNDKMLVDAARRLFNSWAFTWTPALFRPYSSHT